MLLSLSSKPQESQELWRKQFQQYLLMVDRNRMIIASKRRRLPPALRQRLLNDKIKAVEQALAEDTTRPSIPNDTGKSGPIIDIYKEYEHV